MTDRDALGRRRAPAQNRGLRPLHPPLPAGLRSRSIRVAMTEAAWDALEVHLDASPAVTRPRAVGELLENAVREHGRGRLEPVADWQEWQIRKEQRLLDVRTDEAAAS